MEGYGYSDHGATAIKINGFTAQTHCAVVTILALERRQFMLHIRVTVHHYHCFISRAVPFTVG